MFVNAEWKYRQGRVPDPAPPCIKRLSVPISNVRPVGPILTAEVAVDVENLFELNALIKGTVGSLSPEDALSEARASRRQFAAQPEAPYDAPNEGEPVPPADGTTTPGTAPTSSALPTVTRVEVDDSAPPSPN